MSIVFSLFSFFSGTYEIYFFLKQSLNEYIPLLEERTCQAEAPWSAHSQPGGLPVLPSGYHDLLFVHVHCELGGGCCPHGQSVIHATGSAGHRLTEAWRSLSSSLYLGSEVTHTTVTWSRPTPESREVWPSLCHEGEEDWIGEVRDVYHSLSFSLLMIYGFNAVVGNYKVDIICTLKS